MGGRPGTAHVALDAFTRTGYLSQSNLDYSLRESNNENR